MDRCLAEQVKDFIEEHVPHGRRRRSVKELEGRARRRAAAAPVMAVMPGASGRGAAAAPVGEKDEFTVVLTERRATRRSR